MSTEPLLREVLISKLKELQEKQKADPDNKAKYDQQIDDILIQLENLK